MKKLWHYKLPLLVKSLILLSLASQSAVGESIVITPQNIRDALTSTATPTEYLQQAVNTQIRESLESAGVGLGTGTLVYTDILPGSRINDGCNPVDVDDVFISAVVNNSSFLSADIVSLHEPMVLSLNLNAELSVEGSAEQTFGFRVGDCIEVGSDRFSFQAEGPFEFGLTISLDLNPIFDQPGNTLVLQPEVSVTGGLNAWSVSVDVNDTIFRAVLERYLEDKIRDSLSSERIAAAIADVEQSLRQQLSALQEDDSLTIELPAPDDPQIDALYELLSPTADYSLSIAYTRTRRAELLAAIISGDQDWLDDIVSDTAACQASSILQIDLPHAPLYSTANGSCARVERIDTEQAAGRSYSLYLDELCLQPAQVDPVSAVDFCTVALDTRRLGNAASKPEQLESWQFSPGNQFDISAASLAGLEQPFIQRVKYKEVQTAAGLCQLEMRVYSALPGKEPSTQFRSILVLHGGSWQHRSSGFIGVEPMATQFVSRGFVVFVPFYRLLGEREGNVECQQAAFSDITDDANDALDWVVENQERYGAKGRVSLFGQSAGGHLGAMLAINRSDQIERAALFYAPTDFPDFLEELQSGRFVSGSGTRILESVLAQELGSIVATNELLQQNSFPDAISQKMVNNLRVPPLFLLHGEQDSVLPFRQSVRLCNALGGNPDTGVASLDPNTTSARRVHECDDQGSQLHLIAQGQHALDICIADELCLSGDRNSAQLTGDSVNEMLAWMQRSELLAQDSFLDDTDSAARGSSDSALLAILMLIGFPRLRIALAGIRKPGYFKRYSPWKHLHHLSE